jgi:hypothetical protein
LKELATLTRLGKLMDISMGLLSTCGWGGGGNKRGGAGSHKDFIPDSHKLGRRSVKGWKGGGAGGWDGRVAIW